MRKFGFHDRFKEGDFELMNSYRFLISVLGVCLCERIQDHDEPRVVQPQMFFMDFTDDEDLPSNIPIHVVLHEEAIDGTDILVAFVSYGFTLLLVVTVLLGIPLMLSS